MRTDQGRKINKPSSAQEYFCWNISFSKVCPFLSAPFKFEHSIMSYENESKTIFCQFCFRMGAKNRWPLMCHWSLFMSTLPRTPRIGRLNSQILTPTCLDALIFKSWIESNIQQLKNGRQTKLQSYLFGLEIKVWSFFFYYYS